MDTSAVERDGSPAYRQLAALLRKAIAEGSFAVGDRLPSTSQLTTKYAVSLTTARRAIEELRREGIVIGQQGAGVFVRAVPEAVPAPLDERVADLEREVAELKGDRALVGQLQARLMELYSRTGHPYPDAAQQEGPARRRRSG